MSVIIEILVPWGWTEEEEMKTRVRSGKENFLEEGWWGRFEG